MTPHTWYGHRGEVQWYCLLLRCFLIKWINGPHRHYICLNLSPLCLCVALADLLPHEELDRLNDVKFLVQQLYTTLRIEEHQISKERELIGRLEDLNSQLRPLEKV